MKNLIFWLRALKNLLYVKILLDTGKYSKNACRSTLAFSIFHFFGGLAHPYVQAPLPTPVRYVSEFVGICMHGSMWCQPHE